MRKRKSLIFFAMMLMVAITACGQSNGESSVSLPVPDATTEAPTPTEVPVEPEIETLPMLEQLLASNSDMSNLNENFKSGVNLVANIDFGEERISIKMFGENLSYEDVAYADVSAQMEYAGAVETQTEKQYQIYGTDGMITEYTFSPVENVWYKSEYYDSEDGADVSLVRRIAEMSADDFSVVETTSDEENIYITAIPDPYFAMSGKTLFSGLGIEDIEFSGLCKFVFDKETQEFIRVEFVFEYDNRVTEDMKENGITSISVDEFTVVFQPNTTPVVVPDEVIANAVAKIN